MQDSAKFATLACTRHAAMRDAKNYIVLPQGLFASRQVAAPLPSLQVQTYNHIQTATDRKRNIAYLRYCYRRQKK